MTVTELREALQKLEAEGKGALPVVYLGNHYNLDSPEYKEVDAPEIEAKGASDIRPQDGPVVVLGWG